MQQFEWLFCVLFYLSANSWRAISVYGVRIQFHCQGCNLKNKVLLEPPTREDGEPLMESLGLLNAELARPVFPIVLGHEASGIVESVGEGVTKVKAGDHVLPYCLGQCDHCYNCVNDLTNLCKSRPLGWGISTTLIGDPEPHFTTLDGIGAVWNVAKVTPGATVAIIGLGTVGLAVVKACQIAGASRIIGVDINPRKFENAKKFGLTDFINPKEITKPLSQVVKEMSDGGVHYSFECVGVPKLIEETVDCTVQQYGVTVLVGCPSGGEKIEVDVFSLIQGRKITGTSMGGWRIRQIPELAEKCLGKNPEFPVDQFATHRLPFSKLNEGIKLFRSGECLRCILHLEE